MQNPPDSRNERGGGTRADPQQRMAGLDALSAELLTVVDQTMQPTAASLWLRPLVQPALHRKGPTLDTT
jgi:hypothetical protein